MADGIRDAASLLVVSAGPPYRVLMGRRPDSARFMPGVYVFPGGAVEPGDGDVAVSGGFSAIDAQRMQAAPALARALGVAAVRETFEETGILCACDGADEFGAVVKRRAAVDLTRLDYLGRALTPPVSRIRFHARFFVVEAPQGAPDPVASDELGDPCWVDPAAPGELPVPRVTRFMLGELARRLSGTVPPAATPFYHRDDGVYQVDFD